MDLGLLYSNFVIDNRNLTLHTTVAGSGVFRDTDGQTYCTNIPFRDTDPDIEQDLLATNRRLFPSGGIDLFGSMVVAGPTTDIIYVLISDSTTCTADEICPADIQHVVGLRLGPAENLVVRGLDMPTVHPPPETSLTGIFLFSRVSWIRKKMLTEKK